MPKIVKNKKDNKIQYSKLCKLDEYILIIYKSKPNKKILLFNSKRKNMKIEKNVPNMSLK